MGNLYLQHVRSSSLSKDGTPGPLHWECGVLATRPQGKSQHLVFFVFVFSPPSFCCCSSLGRPTYAVFLRQKLIQNHRLCTLMQMECCGVSLTFSETRCDKLMLCFSHLALIFRGIKRTVVSVGIFLKIRKLSDLQEK